MWQKDKEPSASEASESVYMRKRVKHRLDSRYRGFPSCFQSRLLQICCLLERVKFDTTIDGLTVQGFSKLFSKLSATDLLFVGNGLSLTLLLMVIKQELQSQNCAV